MLHNMKQYIDKVINTQSQCHQAGVEKFSASLIDDCLKMIGASLPSLLDL